MNYETQVECLETRDETDSCRVLNEFCFLNNRITKLNELMAIELGFELDCVLILLSL